MHDKYKGLVDILEHAAYCDGQREEHPEGFFFDNTRPAYDSDCDGDPFAASYLTEDEIEFPEEYAPSPYIPGRVMDAMWYLYTVKGWPIARIADKYALQTARVSAILNLKAVGTTLCGHSTPCLAVRTFTQPLTGTAPSLCAD